MFSENQKFIPTDGCSFRHKPWTNIALLWKEMSICLPEAMMVFLHLKPEMLLLSIRSSDIAFTMGAKGPLPVLCLYAA